LREGEEEFDHGSKIAKENVKIGKCENVKMRKWDVSPSEVWGLDLNFVPSQIQPRSGGILVARGKATKERHPGLMKCVKTVCDQISTGESFSFQTEGENFQKSFSQRIVK